MLYHLSPVRIQNESAERCKEAIDYARRDAEYSDVC